MEKFRNLANNIFFKAFLVFVGISFVAFGVGDFILNTSNSWVAKVDNKKIPYKEFVRETQNKRQMIYRYNSDERVLAYLNSSKFKKDIVQNMVSAEVINLTSNYFGVYPSKKLILRDIASYPDFIDDSGEFNKVFYLNYLKRNNLTENNLIEDASKDVSSRIITSSLSYDGVENRNLAKLIYSHKKEKIKADIIVLDKKNLKKITRPKEAELVRFFEKNKDKFTLPEVREVSYIEFTPKNIMPEVIVLESEIADYYNNNSFYSKAASKDFYHLVFDSEIEAYDLISYLGESKKSNKNISKSFLDYALSKKKKEKVDVVLSGLIKQDLLAEISDDVFALELGQYSKILKSSLGFHVFYYAKYIPQTKQELTATIKQDIASNLKKEKYDILLDEKIEEIDDRILTSNSLEAVSKEFGIKLENLPRFDVKGLNHLGKSILEKVKLDNFLENSFNLPELESSELFYSNSNGKYYAIAVNRIRESRNRVLEEVLPQVSQLYMEKRKKEKLLELANQVYNEIEGGLGSSNYHEISRSNNLRVISNVIFERTGLVKKSNLQIKYNADYIDALFNNASNVNRPYNISDEEIHIVILKERIKPKPNNKELEDFSKELSVTYKNEIMGTYSSYLRRLFPVKINYDLIRGDANQR